MRSKTVIALIAAVFASGAALAAGTADEKQQQRASMSQLDTNLDGRISKQEAEGHPAIRENFQNADKNGDGQLDRMEFAAAAGAQDDSEAAE